MGESCRQLPGAMGGCPRQKPTEVSVKESKRILKKFVPHLGDFVEVSHFGLAITKPNLWHYERATLEDKDVKRK